MIKNKQMILNEWKQALTDVGELYGTLGFAELELAWQWIHEGLINFNGPLKIIPNPPKQNDVDVDLEDVRDEIRRVAYNVLRLSPDFTFGADARIFHISKDTAYKYLIEAAYKL